MTTDRILELLLLQFWQVTIVFTFVLLLTRLFAKNRPHLAHALWLVVVLKCLTPPVITSPTGVFSHVDIMKVMQREQSTAATSTSSNLEFEPHPSAIEAPAAVVELNHVTLASAESNSESEPSVTETPFESSQPDTRPVAASVSTNWPNILVGVWLIGVAGIAFINLTSWLRFNRKRIASREEPTAELQQHVNRLAKQVGVHPVRVEVMNSSMGPAVVGLFRSVVLLPACIVNHQNTQSIEPIILHELTHIRRRDLWIATLRILVRTIWWFHPLVWVADRLLVRETERACDEEVVAHLGDAARYAHAMVDVLQLKHPLTVAPAVPGIRPIQITQQRLERIMALRHGCRRKTPWWCWLVLLTMAGLTLPGASTVVGQQLKQAESTTQELESATSHQTPDQSTANTKPAPSRRLTIVGHVEFQGVYEMGPDGFDVLHAIELAGGLDTTEVNPLLYVYRKSAERYGRDYMIVSLKQAKANRDNPHLKLRPEDTIAVVPNSASIPTIWTAKLFPPVEPDMSRLIFQLSKDKPIQFFTNVKATNTLIEQAASKPRLYPMVGQAVLHTSHWNSAIEHGPGDQRTVFKTKVKLSGFQQMIPAETEADRKGDAVNQIRNKLKTAISMDVSALTINQFARAISEKANLNVVVNRSSLMEEGLMLESDHVSLNRRGLFIHSMMASSWLDVVCEQLRLTWVIRGEVIHITTPGRAAGSFENRSYAVADLVVPNPQPNFTIQLNSSTVTAPENITTPKQQQAGFEPLIELIRETIAPNDWAYVGGGGAIRQIESNLSLVIRQRQDVHEEVRKLLESLRRLKDIAITMQIRSLKLSAEDAAGLLTEEGNTTPKVRPSSFRNATILTSDDPLLLRSALAQSGATRFRDNSTLKLQSLTDEQPKQLPLKNGPRVTLANGQHVDISLADLMGGQSRLRVKLIAGADRHSVQLQYSVNFDKQQPGRIRTLNMKRGQVALFNVEEVTQQALLDKNPIIQAIPETNRIYRSVEQHDEYNPLHYLLLSPTVVPPIKEAEQ